MENFGIKDITVSIEKAEIPGVEGLNIPLIIQGGASDAVEFTECKKIADVLAAGFNEDSAVYKQCKTVFEQKERPEKIAVCAVTGSIVDGLKEMKNLDFRQIIAIPVEDGDTLQQLVDYVDSTENKMLFISVDSVEKIPANKTDRVYTIVYKGSSECVEGAVVGATAGLVTGTFTYKNIVLTGIEPDDLDILDVKQIHEAGANCILRKAGDVVTSEGFVLSGEYADVIDGMDYIISNIEYDCQKVANKNKRIAYKNSGISILETTVYNVLKKAFDMGIIDEDENGAGRFSTSFKKREECDADDRKKRIYDGGSFEFALCGAIHYAKIKGTLVA